MCYQYALCFRSTAPAPDFELEIEPDASQYLRHTVAAPLMSPREYAVYFNKPNPHVCIHGPGCSQIKKRGGTHADEQNGEWAFFAEEDEAREHAKVVSKREKIYSVKNCWYCKRNGRLGT